MSFSWYVVARNGWTTEMVGDTLALDDLPDATILGDDANDIYDLFGMSIQSGLSPDDLRSLSKSIRERVFGTHTCNCKFCGWHGPDLGRSSASAWLKRADLFDAIASHDWGMEGGY